MEHIDWPLMFKNVAPFIKPEDRPLLLETAGNDGINPALLLSAAIYYKNEKRTSFKKYIEDISVGLLNDFYMSHNRSKNHKAKQNDAVETVALFVKNRTNEQTTDLKQISELISMYKTIRQEAVKFQKPSNEVSEDSERIKRGEDGKSILQLPYKTSECWMLSATHSNQHCSKKNRRFCPKNSLDMSPNLFMGFGHSFEYFNSEGAVIASHSGYILIHSPCSLQIKSQDYTSYYSHLKIDSEISSGKRVQAGDLIGHIQVDPQGANCNCEIFEGDFECSLYGPHLHWELRDRSGQPLDLDGVVISGYKIFTGSDSYDVGCNQTENCHSNMTMDQIESSCATIFLRMEDNQTFCPSVHGANVGKKLTLF